MDQKREKVVVQKKSERERDLGKGVNLERKQKVCMSCGKKLVEFVFVSLEENSPIKSGRPLQ